MTVEELSAEREKARAEGRAVQSPWRDREAEVGANLPYVLRFRGPRDGETVVNDLIKGPVTVRNKELDDLVLLRSDGEPTYNLAVVVDDHDMGITHVIRGDDHLNNAARQSLIFEALGWEKPAFAHLPLIHGPDGAKLSKRHGAQAVSEFADNYLARLGWGHGDDEVFSDAQAIEWFDVADVVSAPARLDWAKLNFINGQYIRVADDGRLTGLTGAVHHGRGVTVDQAALLRTIPLVKEGAKTILELADLTLFVLKPRPLALDAKTLERLDTETRERLGRLRDQLAEQTNWSPQALSVALQEFSAAEGVGMGKFGPALRGILSGGAPAPDLASALAALAREESLGRFDDALSQLR